MPAERVILRPMSAADGGTGHVRRCLDLARRLGERALLILDNVQLWQRLVPEITDFPRIHGEVEFFGDLPSDSAGNSPQRGTGAPGASGALVVLDCRESNAAQVRLCADYGTPLLLDDDGGGRKNAPFLIDTIPGPRRCAANTASPAYLNLPPKVRTPDPHGPILVSFGGQDPADLTPAVLRALIEDCAVPPSRITVTRPPGKNWNLPDCRDGAAESSRGAPGVRVLPSCDSLREHLGRFGLVICSYGITLWESAAAGCAVLTAEPTRRHAELAQFSALPGIGRVKKNSRGALSAVSLRRLRRSLSNADALINASRLAAEALSAPPGRLDALLASLEAPSPHCAVCGRILPPVIARFERRSFYRCPGCRIIGLYRFECRENEYGPEYFDTEYRGQYGRSYLEDFAAIKAAAAPRLALIQRRVTGGRLLDVGCAYGPFLQAAAERGFQAQGLDISPEAVRYVQDRLGIPAEAGSFSSAKTLPGRVFDAVSLWYVIEHFPDLGDVLGILSRRVRVGGVLAFSTPNGRGISGRRSLKRFLRASPADHYTIWNPRCAVRILRRYGFRVYRIRITGHHPERFRFCGKTQGLVYRCVMVFSRLFGLGDTFEIYAVRV